MLEALACEALVSKRPLPLKPCAILIKQNSIPLPNVCLYKLKCITFLPTISFYNLIYYCRVLTRRRVTQSDIPHITLTFCVHNQWYGSIPDPIFILFFTSFHEDKLFIPQNTIMSTHKPDVQISRVILLLIIMSTDLVFFLSHTIPYLVSHMSVFDKRLILVTHFLFIRYLNVRSHITPHLFIFQQ